MSNGTITSESVLVAGTFVRLGDRVFVVDKVSAAEEAALYKTLCSVARDATGPAYHFKKHRADLEALRSAGMTAEWELLARECAARTMSDNPGPDEFDAARRSAKGVAAELFMRTRRSHPGVQLNELEAVITPANAPDLHEQILAVVTDQKKAPTPNA